MKALAKAVLKEVRARLPEPVRKVARKVRAMVLKPEHGGEEVHRTEEEARRLRAEVQELGEVVRGLGDAMAESSAYWGRALEELRAELASAASGAVSDERVVAYAIHAFKGLPERSVILSLGGGNGAVERALAFLGHRVIARAPWPALWADASVEPWPASEPWSTVAAPAAGLVASAGQAGIAELPFDELSACAPGTRLVVHSAQQPAKKGVAGWRLEDVRGAGEGALMTLVRG